VERKLALRLVAVIAAAFALLAAPTFAANVGFEEIKMANGAEAPLTGGVWYPTDAPETEQSLGDIAQEVAPLAAVAGRNLPLVVLSHGGGGGYDGHYDTALALAHAGFVVAAASRQGDTYNDQNQVLKLWRRPAQLRRLVSYMLDEWPQHNHLDGGRVGAFGFSNGGFTVLVAAGGIPDLSKTGPYCQAHPDHDLCQALKRAGVDPHLGSDVPPDAWLPDPRVKAGVIAAPAFGFAFDRAGLKSVRIPIQLWRAADDRHQPNPWYEEEVRLGLPQPPEYHVVAGAGHYDFLTPCGPHVAARSPQICGDPLSFNRAAFHEQFNTAVMRFFRANLR
jgi:predicted dienelactone hydrolase